MPDSDNGTYFTAIECANNKLYLTGNTFQPLNIATPGSEQPFLNGVSDLFLLEFDFTGARQWGTYFGGDGFEINDNCFANLSINNNAILLSGVTGSNSNLATTDVFQSTNAGSLDHFFVKFDSHGAKIFASYYGGNKEEYTTGVLQFSDDIFYVWGSTWSSNGIASFGSFQPNLNDDLNNTFSDPINVYLAKFEPRALSNTNFVSQSIQLFPNPNTGIFTIKGNLPSILSELSFEIYDLQGRLISTEMKIPIHSSSINKEFDLNTKVSSGVYLLKLIGNEELIKTFKVTIR